MNHEMLPALRLLRDARRFGWRLADVSGPVDNRSVQFERHDEDGRHWVRFDLGYLPGPGEDFVRRYRSGSFVANTTDGELRGAHLGVAHTVRILRAYGGIPEAAA
ncbi:hypothetical protein [Dactylosporangium salmoneum]|uniref:Uncharacterized protein n=1 Tax=Dactylosporangium salmoneum TaxID=53361 RepID=A0ABN3G8T7_9ACTN